MADDGLSGSLMKALTLALILVRWLHLSASILLASLFLFEAAILLPTMRKPSAGIGHLLETIRRLTCRTALWTVLVALMSWFGWSWLVASAMSGDDLLQCLQSGDWWTVLTGTHFGSIWLFRAIIGLIFGIILWVVASTSGKPSFLQTILAGLSVIQLVSLVWAGHATASPGPFEVVHVLADALHLLTSAFWPGALVPLAAVLLLLLKTSQVEAIVLAAPLVRRFSASSLIAVAGMAFTGMLNSIFMVGSFRAMVTSAYGQILAAKLILFCAMIGLGAWNLFLLKPRITVDLPIASLGQKSALLLLLRNVLWEIGLGTIVLLIVGLLGITPPPMR
jgi:putative copper resistance protein D